MKHFAPKRNRHTIDGTGQVLGRLSTRVVTLLRGKHKSTFVPHLDEGDFVTITNAHLIKITGQKKDQKLYHSYSGYPGGLKTKKMGTVFEKNPVLVLRKSIYRMLPKTRHRVTYMKRLTIT